MVGRPVINKHRGMLVEDREFSCSRILSCLTSLYFRWREYSIHVPSAFRSLDCPDLSWSCVCGRPDSRLLDHGIFHVRSCIWSGSILHLRLGYNHGLSRHHTVFSDYRLHVSRLRFSHQDCCDNHHAFRSHRRLFNPMAAWVWFDLIIIHGLS